MDTKKSKVSASNLSVDLSRKFPKNLTDRQTVRQTDLKAWTPYLFFVIVVVVRGCCVACFVCVLAESQEVRRANITQVV